MKRIAESGTTETRIFTSVLCSYCYAHWTLRLASSFPIRDLRTGSLSWISSDAARLTFADGLHEAEHSFGILAVGHSHLAVIGAHFQPVTKCNQFAPFLGQPIFQYFPIIARRLVIESVRTPTTSTTEKYHSSSSAFLMF